MRKHLDKIVLSAIAVIVAATILAVMLVSYFDYRAYYEEATKEPERPPQTLLDDIDVALADGKTFYANNLARVTKDDLVVTAHYTVKTWDKEAPDGFTTEKVDEVVAPEEYELSTPADFAVNGGDITVSFKRKSKTISVSLVPVAPDHLEIVENPYTVVYQTGATFDPLGMAVKVVYNDSSEKLLTAEDYTVDTETPLTRQDTARTVTYSYGTEEAPASKSVDVKISVKDTVVDGDVVAMNNAAAVCYLVAGTRIEDAEVDILGTYESGNRRLLEKEEYIVESDGGVLCLGKQYVLTVRSATDDSLSVKIPVHVRAHIEGESGTIVGGKANTEPEYTFENGEFTQGEDVTFAGGFSNAVKNGKEGSITFNVTSYTTCVTDITIHAGNSYCVQDSAGYWMKPLQINSILDLTVNGEKVEIPDSVVLKGCGPNESYGPLYGVYYDFTFPGVALNAGVNVVKFTFKPSTLGEANKWGESPSTMNLDYMDIDAVGTALPANPNVTEFEIIDDFMVTYDTDFDALNDIKALATLADGTKFILSGDEIVVTKPQGKAALFGNYEIKVALASDAKVSDTRSYTIDKIEAENADFARVNDGKERIFIETANSYHATEGDAPQLVAGESVTAVRGLDWAATNGYNTYVSFDFVTNTNLLNLHISVDNAYYFRNGEQAGGSYITKDYPFNEVMTLFVNGVEVEIPDDVIIEGFEYGTEDDNAIWLMFREIELPNIRTIDGANNITLRAKGKNDTEFKNHWGEVAVPRIDYIRMEPVTETSPATVTSIAPTGEGKTIVGKAWSEVQLPSVYATFSDGTTRLLTKSEYSVSVPQGNVTEERTELTVTYTAAPSITAKIIVNALVPTPNNVKFEASKITETTGNGKLNDGGYWGNLNEKTVFQVTFTSTISEKNHIWLDIANGNYKGSNHFDAEQLNQVLIVKVNGQEISIADTVALSAWDDGSWEHFEWVDLGEVDIPEGEVTIEIGFKKELKNYYLSYVTGNLRTIAVTHTNPGA